jgi:hypothetical protein
MAMITTLMFRLAPGLARDDVPGPIGVAEPVPPLTGVSTKAAFAGCRP